jgi:hypothetical protein
MKHNIEPWEEFPEIWKTKSAFFTWMRGNLRRALWERYPPKIQFKNSMCKTPPADYKGKAKSGTECSLTGEWTPKSYLEVDHIIGQASLKDWEDVTAFIKHLCTNTDNMQLVGKDAHKIKSYAERKGISFENALLEKMVIQMIKNKTDKQFFIDRTLEVPSNATLRRAEMLKLLRDDGDCT